MPSSATSDVPNPAPAVGAVSPAAPTIPPQRQFFPSVTPLPTAPTVTTSVPVPIPPPPTENAAGAAPSPPPQARKVARLVSADTAQSTLKIAADGQLPHLQLQEDDKKNARQNKSKAIPPLVLILAWVFSVVLTVAIVMMTSDDGSAAATSQAKKDAMTKIEDQFFGNPARGELRPYQRMLRDARQARARGDFKAERQYYKQVLDLLHTETWGGAPTAVSRDRLEKGITGSRERDRELEQLILTIVGD